MLEKLNESLRVILYCLAICFIGYFMWYTVKQQQKTEQIIMNSIQNLSNGVGTLSEDIVTLKSIANGHNKLFNQLLEKEDE